MQRQVIQSLRLRSLERSTSSILLVVALLLTVWPALVACTRTVTVTRTIPIVVPCVFPRLPAFPLLRSSHSMSPGDKWLWARFGEKWHDYAVKIERLKAADKAGQ